MLHNWFPFYWLSSIRSCLRLQARSEAARLARDSFKSSLCKQVAEHEIIRESTRVGPLAERQARERNELHRKIAVEEALARKLAGARAAGVSEKALQAAGLLR